MPLRHPRRRSTLRALLTTLLVVTAGVASTPIARAETSVAQLIRNARYWQQRGREDKAADAWAQVLAADPKSPEALVALTNQSLRAGQVGVARDYLSRLKEATPSSPEIPQLERAVELGRRYETILAEARTLAQSGKADEAVVKYRELFAGKEPPQAVALEFYQTLGGTKKGWGEARDGIQALVTRYPLDPHYKLALAKHLSYREETRVEAIHQLETLSTDPIVGRDADEAWRQALSWMAGSAASEPLMTTYLARHPGDTDLSSKLKDRQRGKQRAASLSAAYASLDHGDLDDARRRFEAAGSADAEAVAGLGLVALKKQEFDKATEYLERATRMQPARAGSWARALHSAKFWALVQQARADRDARRYQEAEKELTLAIETSVDDRAEADGVLAEIYVETERMDLAEERLRLLLKEKAEDADAMRQLIGVLLRVERADEAMAMNDRLRTLYPDRAFSTAWIRSEVMRAHAAQNRRQGRMKEARTLLLQAERENPESAWIQFDLANLLLELNELDGASAYADRAASLEPSNGTIRAVSVRILAARGRTSEALEALRHLPPDTINGELKALRHRLEAQAQIELALVHGVDNGGLFELEQLENHLSEDWDMAPLVADAWAKIGDRPRAIKLVRRIIVEKHGAGFGAQLQLASLLFEAHQDEEAMRILAALKNETRLTAAERRGIEELRISATIRMADGLRAKGQNEDAARELKNASELYPENTQLLCALGRALDASGDSPGALIAFNHVLSNDPHNMEAREGAISAARHQGDNTQANRLVDEALKQSPDDPRTHLLAARAAASTGDDTAAMNELHKGESLLPKRSALPESTSASAALTPDQSTAKEIREEIERVRTRHAFQIRPSVLFRYRAGEPGLGLLTAMTIPIGVGVPIGYRGTLSFFAIPTLLNGGTPNVASADIAERFGALMEVPTNLKISDEVAQGAELRLRYDESAFSADLGSTPLGFPIATVQGGVRWSPRTGDLGFSVEALRRPVTDSVLSFAGLQDPQTRRTWGAVMRNAGRAEVSYTPAGLLVFGYFQYGFLLGTEVPLNTGIEAGVGATWAFLRLGDSVLTGGVDVIFLGYGKNLRFFTLGQGGYFSPQAFVHVGVPIEWKGGSQLRWDLQIEPGGNWFQEAATPYYPTDGTLQAAREATGVDSAGNPRASQLAARPNAGFSFDVRGRAWLPISKFMEAGVDVQYHRANDYEELTAGFDLRFDIVPSDGGGTTRQ